MSKISQHTQWTCDGFHSHSPVDAHLYLHTYIDQCPPSSPLRRCTCPTYNHSLKCLPAYALTDLASTVIKWSFHNQIRSNFIYSRWLPLMIGSPIYIDERNLMWNVWKGNGDDCQVVSPHEGGMQLFIDRLHLNREYWQFTPWVFLHLFQFLLLFPRLPFYFLVHICWKQMPSWQTSDVFSTPRLIIQNAAINVDEPVSSFNMLTNLAFILLILFFPENFKQCYFEYLPTILGIIYIWPNNVWFNLDHTYLLQHLRQRKWNLAFHFFSDCIIGCKEHVLFVYQQFVF